MGYLLFYSLVLSVIIAGTGKSRFSLPLVLQTAGPSVGNDSTDKISGQRSISLVQDGFTYCQSPITSMIASRRVSLPISRPG